MRADLDVRVTYYSNLETPEKEAQAINQKLFFSFLKKLGLVGQWEMKHFMGMALYDYIFSPLVCFL